MTATIHNGTSSDAQGRTRGIGFGILFFIITFGLYGWYWAFKTHEEIKQRTGRFPDPGRAEASLLCAACDGLDSFAEPHYRSGCPQPPLPRRAIADELSQSYNDAYIERGGDDHGSLVI